MSKNKMNYQNGKIYCIRSYKTNLVYVGATCQSLSKRLNMHKSNYTCYLKTGKSRYTSYKIYELDDSPYIELIINFPCSCKDELTREEGKYIRSIECVNKRIEGRTKKEYIEDNRDEISKKQKEYYEENREQIKAYHKEYREANKDAILKKNKEYREANKDAIQAYKKEYYEANKDAIQAYKNQKFACPCGGDYTRSHKAKHEKTIKHQQFIKSQ